MEDNKKENSYKSQKEYIRQIASKTARKLDARKKKEDTVWFGLGMMGMIGWSVTIPTLLGAALGSWLDEKYPGKYSWTLMMLTIGLVTGCLVAWSWIKRQDVHSQDLLEEDAADDQNGGEGEDDNG